MKAYTIVLLSLMLCLPSSILGRHDFTSLLNGLKGRNPTNPPPAITLHDNGAINWSNFDQYMERLLDNSLYENSRFIARTLRGRLIDLVENLCDRSLSPIQKASCLTREKPNVLWMTTKWLERIAGRFLYASGYRSMGQAMPQAEIDQISEVLIQLPQSQGCPNNSTFNRGIASVLLLGSQAQYQSTMRQMRRRGEACHDKVLLEMSRILHEQQYPQTCRGVERKSDLHICNDLLREYQVVKERLSAFITLAVPGITSEGGSCSYLSLPSTEIAEQFLTDMRAHRECGDYFIGEQRTIDTHDGPYHITRESDSQYKATIPLKFSPAEDYDNEQAVPREQAPAHYFNLAKECIDDANSMLIGPNGKRLLIDIQEAGSPKSFFLSLLDKVSGDKSSPEPSMVHNIEIKSASFRSNAHHYASDIDCPTIIHEVLHLLGLDDEYNEKSRGKRVLIDGHPAFLPHYNCRVTQTNSIMANHHERRQMIRLGRELSLLDPTHFNAILYGQCPTRDDVRLYRECSTLIYTTGYNEENQEDCPELKQQCEVSNILGKDKERELDYLTAQLRRYENNIIENSLSIVNILTSLPLEEQGPLKTLMDTLQLNPYHQVPNHQIDHIQHTIIDTVLLVEQPEAYQLNQVADLLWTRPSVSAETLDRLRKRIAIVRRWP